MDELQQQIVQLQNQVNELGSKIGKNEFSNVVMSTKEVQVQNGEYRSNNFVTGTSGWQLTAEGNLEANNGYFRGDLTGATGTFSGTIAGGSLDIGGDDASSFHVDSGGGIWSGASVANKATAPFRVSNAGALVGTSATITGAITTGSGSSLDGIYLVATSVNSASVNLALQGWTFTSVFSSTDYNTVAWTAGTFTSSAGTAYSIDAGNTGNITATNYIFLKPATSATVLQKSITAGDAVGNGIVLLAVVSPNTDTTSDAIFQVFGGTGGQQIAVDNISANSASTNEFVSNTAQIGNLIVTNAKINDLGVDKLTAGSITSKAITLAVSAGTGDSKIQAGKTDFTNTDAGFILGVDDSDSDKAKFYIGDATSYLNWDGTTLTIQGISQVIKSYTAGESVTAGDAVYMEDSGTSDVIVVNTNTSATTDKRNIQGAGTGNSEKSAQNFTESSVLVVNKVKVYLRKIGLPTDNLVVSIQADSAGSPSGTVLFSGSIAGGSVTGTMAEYTITLDSAYTSTANTKFHVVLARDGAGDTDKYYICGGHSSDTSTYANGDAMSYQIGSAWFGAGNSDIQVKLITTTVEGRLWKTSTATAGQYETFLGFVKTTTASGSSCPVVISGEITGLTGLTTGGLYYISDTRGVIASSAGSATRKCGIATSATTLLLTNIW
jgi:hypothetical protein